MRLGYFAMPMHPPNRPWTATLEEDRQAVILADQLGFHDAFIGEHLTDRYENITNSMVFLASLIHDTERIKLGTGTANLSQMHPGLVAANAAMLDHMSNGRLILGISPGALPSDAELLGIFDRDRNAMFVEAIDTILELWSGAGPYDIGGEHWQAGTTRTFSAELGLGSVRGPLQSPHPEIVGTVVAPFSKGVIAMGEKDFHPLSANFLLPAWLNSHWVNYSEGVGNRGGIADPADWRVARTVFVADDDKVAVEYGRASAGSVPVLLLTDAEEDGDGGAAQPLQGGSVGARRVGEHRNGARSTGHLWHTGQGGRRDPVARELTGDSVSSSMPEWTGSTRHWAAFTGTHGDRGHPPCEQCAGVRLTGRRLSVLA